MAASEPGLAGTAMVAGSVLGLEHNGRSLNPLVGRYWTSGRWENQMVFQGFQ
jgi:hypothetical protein